MIHITKNIILKNKSFGMDAQSTQGACFGLCCIIALCFLGINTAVAGIIFLFGGVVLIIGSASDDRMRDKQRKLGQELATELNSWLIPLIEENISQPEKIDLIGKYQDVFIQYQCKDVNQFLNKYYYPQIGSRLVYKNAIPPYGHSVITLFHEYAPGKVGTGFEIDIDGKTHNIESINNYKQRHDNIEFAKLVQEIYDAKKQEEKLIVDNTYTNINEALIKIEPILAQNTEKLSKVRKTFAELANTQSMAYFTFEDWFDSKATAEVLNKIFHFYA